MFTGNGNSQHPVDGSGHGKTAPPQFYFTIDCDWVPGSHGGLEMLLNLCDRYHLKGTIFFAGRFAETYPDLVRDCHDRGHQLGTHGWAHGGLDERRRFPGRQLRSATPVDPSGDRRSRKGSRDSPRGLSSAESLDRRNHPSCPRT